MTFSETKCLPAGTRTHSAAWTAPPPPAAVPPICSPGRLWHHHLFLSLSLSHIHTHIHTHSAERFYFHLADFWRRIREEEEGGGSRRRSWEQQRERQVAVEQITQLISSSVTSWIHKKQANVDVSSLWGEGDGVWRESAECLPAAAAARITLHSGNTTLLLFIFCRVRTPSWYHVFWSVLVLSGKFQSQAVKPFFWHTSMLVRKWWCQSILICIRDQISDHL